jgi:hypothetical protein
LFSFCVLQLNWGAAIDGFNREQHRATCEIAHLEVRLPVIRAV